MFNDSYLRACMKLRIVQKIRFSLLESGRTKAWCPGLVSRPSAKAQEPVARSRRIIQPPKLSVVHILSFCSQAMVSLFIFPTGPSALNFEPRGRRYVKNMIHNRNRLATGSYALALGRDTKTLSRKKVEGLLFRPPKLSVGAYFELSFLGCGFLIHLSNRYDNP